MMPEEDRMMEEIVETLFYAARKKKGTAAEACIEAGLNKSCLTKAKGRGSISMSAMVKLCSLLGLKVVIMEKWEKEE